MKRVVLSRLAAQVLLRSCRATASTSASTRPKSDQQNFNLKPKRRDPSDVFGLLGSLGAGLSPIRMKGKKDSEKDRDAAWDLSDPADRNPDVPTKGLRRFELKEDRELVTISMPVTWSKRKKKKLERELKAREEYETKYGVDYASAKVVIECARKEFNHFAGMRYPTSEIPLVSQFWAKNKYKDDWFVIRHTSKNPSFDWNVVSCWEQCLDLVDSRIVENLIMAGFKQPTVIQYRAFNAFRGKEHLFIAAETGSGKTVAYAAPLLSDILRERENGRPTKALVLVLSKELKAQTKRMIDQLVDGTGLQVSDVDTAVAQMSKATEKDWDILVATPGLAQRLLSENDNSDIGYMVIDEADMLLDDSFVDVMSDILAFVNIRYSETNTENQGNGARVIFSSASCPPELEDIVGGVVDSSHLFYIRTNNLHAVMPHVDQKFIRVREMDKMEKLMKILEKDADGRGRTLVFCKDKKTAKFVSGTLTTRNIKNFLIGSSRHKNTEPDDLNNPSVSVLIGTDGASRGLDIDFLKHVVNYDFPRHMVDYIHRVGRVGRVGSKFACHVTSFVRCPWEVNLVNSIELAARFDRPIKGVEANVSGILKERKANIDVEEDVDIH